MAKSPDPLNLDSMLCFAVYAAGHAFTRFYKPRLDAIGLTYPQYLVFLVLWEADDLSVKALGDRLFLDSGTITPMIKRLESRGLLLRRRDDNDERMVRIRLTDAGRELRAKALAVPLEVGAALSTEGGSVDALRAGLHRLRGLLDEASAQSEPSA